MRASLNLLGSGLYLGAILNLAGQALSTVQFISASNSVRENAGNVTMTVQRIGPPNGLEIVDLTLRGFGIGEIKLCADGATQLTLDTCSGRSCTLESSTNLMDWESLETRIASDSKLILADTNALKFERRFYRAVSQ